MQADPCLNSCPADQSDLVCNVCYEIFGEQLLAGLGQLGARDVDDRLIVVPFRRDKELREERLAVAAFGLLVCGGVDRVHSKPWSKS
jgi:hypothetical protein